MDDGIHTNVSPIFQGGPRISLLNITPAALTEKELKQRAQRRAELATDPVEKLRYSLLALGFAGIKEFARLLRTRGQTLGSGDFTTALQRLGMKLREDEVANAFKQFSGAEQPTASYSTIIDAIKPSLNNVRKTLVDDAFAKVDRRKEGAVTVDDLKAAYHYRKNPQFASGAKTKEEVLHDFIQNAGFDKHVNGKISKEDFVNYYSAVSAGVDGDIYFDHIMRHTWGI